MIGDENMPNMIWSQLNNLQLGEYGEYYAKMEFASYGFKVFTSEVDDHGVDFIAQDNSGKFYEVQVKAIRGSSYTFIKQDKIILDDVHLVCYLRFTDGSLPEVYIFPATVWNSPDGVFTIHDYKRPEYGISGAKKYRKALEPYKAINFFEHLSQPHC